jgi:SPX domain protein involved in polyphosphate accumulation
MLWKVWHAASGYIILPIEIRPSGPTKTIIASHPSVAQSEIYRHQPTANPQTKADTTEFRRIAALADLLLGTNDGVDVDLRSLTNRRLETDPWTLDHSGGNVVVLLSDVYTVIRELEAQSSQPCRDRDISDKNESSNKKWVAPASFHRVTTKYWVHDEHLYRVLLASVSDLPLLVYGRRGK